MIPPNFLAIFFQKRLKISCIDETFDVFVPSFHHSVVNIANPNVIYGGQKIKIPGTSAPTGYRIKVNVPALNCRQGPGMGYKVNRVLFSGETYGVTEEKKDSAGNSWGKLKEVDGWCALRYTKKI